jgi:hypothetical protein
MKRLLLVALMILVTLVGMVGFSRAAEDPATQSVTPVIGNRQLSLDAISNDQINAVGTLQATVNDGVTARAKMYYLTVTSFTGGDAIKACDPRFHMASISEIKDPSNLQYATRSTPAYDAPTYDQGLGPPSNHMGWVRSGVYPQSGFAYACDVYLTGSDLLKDTMMTLYTFWFDARSSIPASQPDHVWWQWHAAYHPCSQPEPVWCVEDPE